MAKMPAHLRPKGQKSKLWKYKDEIQQWRMEGYSYSSIISALKSDVKVNITTLARFCERLGKQFKPQIIAKPQESLAPTPPPRQKQEQKLLFGKTDEQRIREFKENAERIMREREAVLALPDPDE